MRVNDMTRLSMVLLLLTSLLTVGLPSLSSLDTPLMFEDDLLQTCGGVMMTEKRSKGGVGDVIRCII